MSSFNSKEEGLCFAEKYEKRVFPFLFDFYYKKWGIQLKEKTDKYDVDLWFNHPKTNKLCGIELKTCKPENLKFNNIPFYESSQSANTNEKNQIYKYFKQCSGGVHLAWNDEFNKRIFLIYNQDIMHKLFNFDYHFTDDPREVEISPLSKKYGVCHRWRRLKIDWCLENIIDECIKME